MDSSLIQFNTFGTCYPMDANIFVILLICVSSGMAKGVISRAISESGWPFT
jgi:uncharacterized membrane protein required for colicin V production